MDFCGVEDDNHKYAVNKDLVMQRETVTDMYWDSPLGVASYTGEVAPDSVTLTGKKIPHGKGIARITGGEFDGTFKNGSPDKGDWYDKNGNKL